MTEPQTVTEKILAAHVVEGKARAGEFVTARVDLCLGNDITAPIAIREFEALETGKVFDPARIALVPDHFTPNKDIKSAEQAKVLRDFAEKYAIENYFEIGRMGIEHALLPEGGLVVPGDLVIGADSHTCTYGALGAFSTGIGSTDLAACLATGEVWLRVPESMKFVLKGALGRFVTGKDIILEIIGRIGVDGALYRAMEYTGEGAARLSMSDRLTICNMAIEAGAKSGIFPPDAVTAAYEKDRAKREPVLHQSDPDATYHSVHEVDLTSLVPVVACPHLPSNVKPAAELGDTRIDQVVIGSCTNGRIEDLAAAAEVLRGRRVAPGVRCIVIPATQAIWREAMHAGLFDVFVEAGCAVSTPTCGPCLGGHMGVLAAGERAVATTNRNFVGRMGSPESEVYLAGPFVAAASAVAGRIAAPAEILGE